MLNFYASLIISFPEPFRWLFPLPIIIIIICYRVDVNPPPFHIRYTGVSVWVCAGATGRDAG